MNLNDYTTRGWKIFQIIKHPELAKEAVRRFKKLWDLRNIYDVKLIKQFDTHYVVVRKKRQLRLNPMTKEEALHFESHLKKDMRKFDKIATRADEIKYLAEELKDKDKKELAEMEVNPRSLLSNPRGLVSIWIQFNGFAKAGIYDLTKKDWLDFAESYQYGGSTRKYAEDFWDRRDDEYGGIHPDEGEPIEPNPNFMQLIRRFYREASLHPEEQKLGRVIPVDEELLDEIIVYLIQLFEKSNKAVKIAEDLHNMAYEGKGESKILSKAENRYYRKLIEEEAENGEEMEDSTLEFTDRMIKKYVPNFVDFIANHEEYDIGLAKQKMKALREARTYIEKIEAINFALMVHHKQSPLLEFEEYREFRKEINPIPRIIPIVPTMTMRESVGSYVVITARRKEQPIDVLGKYGLVQETKKYEGAITRVYYRKGREQFRRKAHHAFHVLLEDGTLIWFDDWQIDFLRFERLSLIEEEFARESIEEIKKKLAKQTKRKKEISQRELKDYIGKWKKRYAEVPKRTAYDYFYELFAERKKEEPSRKDKAEHRTWVSKVNKLLPKAIKALGEDKCKSMMKGIGYEIIETGITKPKKKQLLEGGYKYFYDLLKDKKEAEPPKTAKIEYGKWSKQVQTIVNKTVKSIGAQNALHMLKKLQYEVEG